MWFIADYYEEVLTLANSVIAYSVSEPMWEIFFDIHKLAISLEGIVFAGKSLFLFSFIIDRIANQIKANMSVDEFAYKAIIVFQFYASIIF